jgi:hypothetical protein
MSSQIFKSKIPNDIVFQLLKDIAVKSLVTSASTSTSTSTGAKDDVYIVNNNVYKKGIFNGKISAFYEVCKPYYHLSKRKYLDKKISYNTFITVIRQICNSNKITYTSQIKYDKSVYDIIYSITVPNTLPNTLPNTDVN